MNRRKLFGAAAATVALGMMQSVKAEEKQMDKGFVSVNGQEMYFERHGKGGTPLVLLHGAFSAIGTSFGAMLPKLAERVYAVPQSKRLDTNRKFVLSSPGGAALRDRPAAAGPAALPRRVRRASRGRCRTPPWPATPPRACASAPR